MSAAAGGWARFGLIALLVAVALGALLLSSANPAGAQSGSGTVDYDTDNDNLIEVSTPAQLNAIRWDLNGDGAPVSANANDYATAFPTPAANMGCAATCLGYELEADLDLDLDTYSSGAGWMPIGAGGSRYSAIFDGNGHTIANLFINRSSTGNVGLFAYTTDTSAVRNVGLVDANVTGQNDTGALIGSAYGTVDFAYSTGSVSGASNVGGLVGHSTSTIQRSYSTANVTGIDNVGGLVGNSDSVWASPGVYDVGVIKASYATGTVSGRSGVGGLLGGPLGATGRNIIASYATGSVNGTGVNVGGLVGRSAGTVTNSYWDVTTTGRADDGIAATGTGKPTAELQSPTQANGYAGIYANWNLNLDSTAGADDPWDFGTASQYPALKADFNRDGVKSAVDGDFGRQPRAAPVVAPLVDYDTDADGLIEVRSLAQLNAIRYDLNGDGAFTDAGYALAFPNPAAGMGCPDTDSDAATPNCLGYELTADLDFNTDTTGSSAAVVDSSDDYWDSGAGWTPIGAGDGLGTSGYAAIFEGNGHTIANLFIDRSSTRYVGLFGFTTDTSAVRNVGLVDANVTGRANTGALIGSAYGTVDFAYSTGSVSGASNVGGLVGYTASTIQRSYSTANVTSTSNHVGGLAGSSDYYGVIKASYATGTVNGSSVAGGLVGESKGEIIASYATGLVAGTGGGVGGLAGSQLGTVTNSYWDVTTSGIADDNDASTGAGKTTAELQLPTQTNGYAGIYANWNLDLDADSNADDPWDFGTASQYPALKADFNRDGVKSAVDGDFGRQPRAALVDYDSDNDGLIDVDSLAKLNAIRWDLDGNGAVAAGDQANYNSAFPNPAASMGCPITSDDADDNDCLGYELTADLDFNTDTTGSSAAVVDSSDDYWDSGAGWTPIGDDHDQEGTSGYAAIFEGNGHTIANLFINRSSTRYVGLFGSTTDTSIVRNVGLVDANVTGRNSTGALIGTAYGTVDFAYSTGSVSGASFYVGGLAGYAGSAIQRSYSTANVTSTSNYVGGLVGYSSGYVAVIRASYATGTVSGGSRVGGLLGGLEATGAIAGSYATGSVNGTGGNVGGLVGESDGRLTNSYWDVTTSGRADDNDASTGEGKTTSQLQSPTQTDGYAGIYANWNLNLDGTAGGDDPWDFGTASQYPALKADFNRDGVKSAVDGDFGRQPRAAPVVAPVNTAPTFDAGYDTTPNVAEGVTAVGSYAATDPEGDALTYAVTGTDATDFAISTTGALTLNNAANHETKPSYSVSVTVHDGKDAAGAADTTVDITLALTVTVDDTLEPPTAPTDVGVVGIVNGLRVTWTAPVMPTTHPSLSDYDVQHSVRTSGAGVSPVTWGSWLVSNHVGTGTTATILGLTPGSTYRVQVLAHNAEGDSPWTAPVNGVPAAPVVAPLVDYDSDADGLIEVRSLAQLNAIRYDLNGDGATSDLGYAAAFPNPMASMGCSGGCSGYELMADLDLGTYSSGAGWEPIGNGDGLGTSGYAAIFEGNGHTIANLFINRSSTGNVGLFGFTTDNSTVRNVGLVGANVTGRANTGALIGSAYGTVDFAYSTGSVSGAGNVGGLAGYSGSTIQRSYSTANVIGTHGNVGGLVGYTQGGVKASYATGTVNGIRAVGGLVGEARGNITASYATGLVTGTGRLVGNYNGATITNSYWDVTTTGRADDNDASTGEGKTTSQLQSPTQTDGYAGIYANWNLNLDGTAGDDDPWDFGTNSQYPALKAEWDGDGTATAYEFGQQGRVAPTNTAPTFTAGYDATPHVAEGVTAVGSYAATDPEGDALTYAVTGTDATDFAISTTGALTLNNAANHETKPSYSVSVTVHDGKDAAGAADTTVDITLALTVTVDDTLEPPTAPTDVGVVGIVNGLRVTWTAPVMPTTHPSLSDYDVQHSVRTSGAGVSPVTWGSWLVSNHVGTGTTATILGLTPGSTYRVQVLAHNAEGDSPWTAPVNGVPAAAPVVAPLVDYDTDADGLIEVRSLAQLNAIRYDLNGDGATSDLGYAAAFPNPMAGMGCSGGCSGYELMANLDFDENNDGAITEVDDPAYWNGGEGWDPLGGNISPGSIRITIFSGAFEGNNHSIANLFIDRPGRKAVGLFGGTGGNASIRNLSLTNANVSGGERVGALVGYSVGDVSSSSATGQVNAADKIGGGLVGLLGGMVTGSHANVSVDGGNQLGGLAGYIHDTGAIAGSYATGNVSGDSHVGGLVGHSRPNSVVTRSYATGGVTATGGDAGGLVGRQLGRVQAAYATGSVTAPGAAGGLTGVLRGSLEASYATGQVQSGGMYVGGLVGAIRGAGAVVTNSYWDTATSTQSNSAGGMGKTTAELQTPTGYNGIYADWNVDLDADGTNDDPWHFGTSSEYPALKYDTDNDGTATWEEFGAQPRTAPAPVVDYDSDADGLIEVRSLAQLNAIRYDLNGDGATSDLGYAAAFPNPMAGMGCSGGCSGYELMADLDFDENNDDAITELDDPAYWNGGEGWDPLGGNISTGSIRITIFSGAFEGNNHSIANLFIDRPDRKAVGLFGGTDGNASIRNLSLTNANVSGGERVGALVGYSVGDVSSSSATGQVNAAGKIGGGLVGLLGGMVTGSHANVTVSGGNQLGGLVGYIHDTGAIAGSYSTGNVSGDSKVGGLVGHSRPNSVVTRSYASGGVTATATGGGGGIATGGDAGGLVGRQLGLVQAAYATGSVTATGAAGGLTGVLGGSLEASYATGQVQSGGMYVGGLVGAIRGAGAVTNGYWDTATSGQSNSAGGMGKTTAELQTPTGYNGIYANWNVDVDGNNDDPWDFGTDMQYPALKSDFNNDGTATWEEFGSQHSMRVARSARSTRGAELAPPGQPAAPSFINVAQTAFRITWTASAAGSSAISGYGIQYKLDSEEDSAYADVNPTPTGTVTGYNLVNRNGQTITAGTSYHVRVRAKNAEGWGLWSEAASVVTAGAAPSEASNNPPSFVAASATVEVAENTASGTAIGDPVTATDPDVGDTLTYTLGTTMDDGHFAIDTGSGQLRTKGDLDYESKDSYAVTVTATDGGGLSASVEVTITVTDVADTPPGQPDTPEIINVEETSFRVTWTAPAGFFRHYRLRHPIQAGLGGRFRLRRR